MRTGLENKGLKINPTHGHYPEFLSWTINSHIAYFCLIVQMGIEKLLWNVTMNCYPIHMEYW